MLLFIIIMASGVIVFSMALITGVCKRHNGERGAVRAPRWPLERTQALIVSILVASLIIVLSEARAGYFSLLDSYCLGSTAVGLGLVPLMSSSVALLLSICRKISFTDHIWTQGHAADAHWTIGGCLAILFSLWYLVATIILTFFGPFTSTSNPFAGCWMGLLASIMMLVEYVASARRLAERARSAIANSDDEGSLGSKRPFAGLLVASAVVFGACLRYLSTSGEAVFIFVSALLTVAVVSFLLCKPAALTPAWRTVVAILLMLLWVAVTWFSTFVGPFVVTGNGFFATCASAKSFIRTQYSAALPACLPRMLAPRTHPACCTQLAHSRRPNLAGLGIGCAVVALIAEAGAAAEARAGLDTVAVSPSRMVRVTVEELRARLRRHLLGVVGVASLVVVLLSSNGRQGVGLYALCCGGISLALVLTVTIHRALNVHEATELAAMEAFVVCRTRVSFEALLAAFLTIWWAVGASVLTFYSPFTVTSNPYFASCELLHAPGPPSLPFLSHTRGASPSP